MYCSLCQDPHHWSLAAMEIGLADEYIINDSDNILIDTLRLIWNKPDLVKKEYASLIQQYSDSLSKKKFFLDVINQYNQTPDQEKKSLILPFIINHSWVASSFMMVTIILFIVRLTV